MNTHTHTSIKHKILVLSFLIYAVTLQKLLNELFIILVPSHKFTVVAIHITFEFTWSLLMTRKCIHRFEKLHFGCIKCRPSNLINDANTELK